MQLSQVIQLDLFIHELRQLEEHQKEEKDKKANRKLRAAFHLLGDVKKQIKEKTPQ